MPIHNLQAVRRLLFLTAVYFAEYLILRGMIRLTGECDTSKCRQTPYARLSANIIANPFPRRI